MERISVAVDGHTVTAFSEGAGDDVILVVHGGPGVPCDYVRNAHLCYAEQGYRVVSWDQLGCGESDRPDDDSLWTVERYVEEMETVRAPSALAASPWSATRGAACSASSTASPTPAT